MVRPAATKEAVELFTKQHSLDEKASEILKASWPAVAREAIAAHKRCPTVVRNGIAYISRVINRLNKDIESQGLIEHEFQVAERKLVSQREASGQTLSGVAEEDPSDPNETPVTDSQDDDGDDAYESATSSRSGPGRAAGEDAEDFSANNQTHDSSSSGEVSDDSIPGHRSNSDRGRAQSEEEQDELLSNNSNAAHSNNEDEREQHEDQDEQYHIADVDSSDSSEECISCDDSVGDEDYGNDSSESA
jgi:hypothetical protein